MSSTPSGFPTLQPAVVTKINVGEVHDLGTIHTGSRLVHFECPTGTVESAPGFEPAFRAKINFGADWLSFDPDGKHARVDLKGMARTEEGYALDFRYEGVIKLDDDLMKIFNMQADMATVPFGRVTGKHSFLTADPKLKSLENNVFVSNSRIVVHEKGMYVETRQSLVIPASTMD